MSIITALEMVSTEFSNQLIRAITGRLFTTEQIRAITSHSIGKHLSELFPTEKEELERQQRFEAAKSHIDEATQIIAEMRSDLEAQNDSLNRLMEEIDKKQMIAERYAHIANTKEAEVQAVREEWEIVLRNELEKQSEEGKAVRRIVSISLWVFTLIAGAAAGHFFPLLLEVLSATA